MRTLILGCFLALSLAAPTSAEYHEPIFLTGGDASTWSTIKPLFDPGPGVLDAIGEAKGVLDPNAPLGIACLPDTYVVRVP